MNPWELLVICTYRLNFRVEEVYPHDEDNNLRYALRASGASFGIVTEFVYKVYPHPETLSCVVLVYIHSGRDLERLVQAGQDGRYGISILQPMFFRRPKTINLVSSFYSSLVH